MIKKIGDSVWQLSFENLKSCVYLIKIGNENILIDTSAKENREDLIRELKKLNLSPESINIVLLTHNHYDHAGNVVLFKNSKIYGNYNDFKSQIIFKNSLMSQHAIDVKFCKEHGINILDTSKLNLKNIQIINTPGHTKGSVCFFMTKEKILFSGDTLFNNGFIGRTDLPNSSPEKMTASLEKLKNLDYKILCPGHSY